MIWASFTQHLSEGRKLHKFDWIVTFSPDYPCVTKLLGYRFKKKHEQGLPLLPGTLFIITSVIPREVSHCPIPSSGALVQGFFPKGGAIRTESSRGPFKKNAFF